MPDSVDKQITLEKAHNALKLLSVWWCGLGLGLVGFFEAVSVDIIPWMSLAGTTRLLELPRAKGLSESCNYSTYKTS